MLNLHHAVRVSHWTQVFMVIGRARNKNRGKYAKRSKLAGGGRNTIQLNLFCKIE